MNRKRAEKIVNKIVLDITDRRGIKHEWNNIDEDIQKEIKEKWINIILEK